MTNAAGTCAGTETCDGKTAQWKGCTAATPAAESCNGKDDDCNGKIDDGDPNSLCAALGPTPQHASWSCMGGMCKLGACDPGWTAYPAGQSSAGCTCPLEANEPNGTCATAAHGGSVSDVGGSPLVISGTLSSASDVDVWAIDTNDTVENATNSYHVNIVFKAPTPNDEFVMDVMRGAPCSDMPSGPTTGITSYDWCVNGNPGTTPQTGEIPCSATGAAHCGGSDTNPTSTSHTATYYVRVYRKAGATGTCTQYQLQVTGGGGTCDFSQKCP